MEKFNLIAFSKSKKYQIIMIALMSFGAILAAVGFIMYSSVSKTTTPRKLTFEGLSGAVQIEGKPNEYELKLSQDEPIYVSTGTDSMVLATPIEFIRDDNRYLSCVDIIEKIEPMYVEGATMIRLKQGAANHSTGTLIIRCGSVAEIIIHIEVSLY
jgi:hypothetical protein